jgi:hypothetical protein
MNTSPQDTTPLKELSFVAAVSCVVSAAWFFVGNWIG